MKIKFRILACLLIAVLAFSACANGSGGNSSSKANSDAPNSQSGASSKGSKEPLKVALVLSGFLGDKSFNDSGYEGLQKAVQDYGIEVKVMESKVPAEWESNFVAMCSGNYDLVIAGSSQFSDIIKKHSPEFPNQKIVLIDGVVKGDNILSTMFAQNEGSFLAGAAAALFTTKTDLPNVNPDKTIGWIGGMETPVLSDFYTGYEQGAKFIDPNIKILQSYAGSFSDPLKGKELAMAQYNQGADIIMNVASSTGTGILEAAKESGKYAIGVDMDQDSEQPGHVLTSMVKRVNNATYLAVKSVVDGTFKGNSTIYLDLTNDGVGLTDMSVMKKALGDKFPQDIYDKVNELKQKIISGEIKVNFYPGFGKQS